MMLLRSFGAVWLALWLTGCSTTHQDLKAPYEIDPLIPVLDQWDDSGDKDSE